MLHHALESLPPPPALPLSEAPLEEWLNTPPGDWFPAVSPPPLRFKALATLADRIERPPLQLSSYKTRLVDYAVDVMGITPWAGENGSKGQLELLRDIEESARLQLEGDSSAPRVFRVDAGHGVGKTYSGAVIVNWFFDCFTPSITITTAPTAPQVETLLWKDIKTQRSESRIASSLPGKISPRAPGMYRAPNHFAIGRVASNSGGQGTARFQGQHGKYLLFIIDEAEGVADFIFDAVNAMMTGGVVVLCVMFANPMTRISRFHRESLRPGVMNYNFDVLNTPNVVTGKDIIPGLTTRRWVQEMISTHCQLADEHDPDKFTFTVPFPTEVQGGLIVPAGSILEPDSEFLFRARGIPPWDFGVNTFISPGRFDAARKRTPDADAPASFARLGVDVARFGSDYGTLYLNFAGALTRKKRLNGQRVPAYVAAVREVAETLPSSVTSFHVRVDGTGGFGSGIVDALRDDPWYRQRFKDFKVLEINFGSRASDSKAYANRVTEMYAMTAEALLGLALPNASKELEMDLTGRVYEWRMAGARAVRALEDKERARVTLGRSPDDGDGAVLAASPDFIFANMDEEDVSSSGYE
jgi:hypothetical protein